MPVTTVTTTAVVAGAFLIAAHASTQAREADGTCPRDPAPFHRCAVERAKTFNPPRTADGAPDFQGIWRGQTSGVENIEEHPETNDVGAGPTLIVDPADGRIPYQPWAVAARKEHFGKYIDPNVACFLSGVPRMLYTPGDIQIAQSAGIVVILHSRGHMYRAMRTDNPPHLPGSVRLWQGESSAHWEGHTLVVDVTNQNGKTWLDQTGNFHSDAVHIVERYTMVDRHTIHYEARIDDPAVYTRPWTMAFALRRVTQSDYELLEEACHEGERNTSDLITLGYRLYPGMSGRH